jgi:hypothetical protein
VILRLEPSSAGYAPGTSRTRPSHTKPDPMPGFAPET